jgi:hypothetical protein
LRPDNAFEYRGHSGPWVEHVFFAKWSSTERRPGERLYLPVFWADYYFSKKREEVQVFLDSLSTNIKNYTVINLDNGFDVLELVFPEGLDLMLFAASGGGNTTPDAIPVPLLKKELAPSGLPKALNVS